MCSQDQQVTAHLQSDQACEIAKLLRNVTRKPWIVCQSPGKGWHIYFKTCTQTYFKVLYGHKCSQTRFSPNSYCDITPFKEHPATTPN
jgi:hypothetical protein